MHEQRLVGRMGGAARPRPNCRRAADAAASSREPVCSTSGTRIEHRRGRQVVSVLISRCTPSRIVRRLSSERLEQAAESELARRRLDGGDPRDDSTIRKPSTHMAKNRALAVDGGDRRRLSVDVFAVGRRAVRDRQAGDASCATWRTPSARATSSSGPMIRTGDEFEELAAAFNRMLRQLLEPAERTAAASTTSSTTRSTSWPRPTCGCTK